MLATAASSPSSRSHIWKQARVYCSGRPTDLKMMPEQFQPDAVPGPGPEVAGGGVQPAVPLGRVREFLQEVLHAGRQLGQAPGLGPVRELEVGPEVLEHLDQVRLAGAEEAADPDARLLGLVEVAEVGAEDAAQPLRVLAVADEVREFVAQGLEFRGWTARS